MKSRNPILLAASMLGLHSMPGGLSADTGKLQLPPSMPYQPAYAGRPNTGGTSPKDFFSNGKHLNGRKLWRRRRKNGGLTSPNKSTRLKARKGFRMGRTV